MIQPLSKLPAGFVPQPQLTLPYASSQVSTKDSQRAPMIPYTIGVVAEWPATVSYAEEGGTPITYYRTDKVGVWPGTGSSPNIPCAEYQCLLMPTGAMPCDLRVWLLLNGNLMEDF